MEPLAGLQGRDPRVLVGPETADDAGAFAFGDAALVATADFITPVCDDPYRFGRVAAANSMSDVFAMGGEVLFALNLCCFPEDKAPSEVFTAILRGASDAVADAGGAILGGHSVADRELKFGLAVVGNVDPAGILTNAGAEPGQRIVLTKPLGSGVVVNGFRAGKLDLAIELGATACTDVTGFGLANHALEVARASGVGVRIDFERLAAYSGFYEMAAAGVSTRGAAKNRLAAHEFEDRAGLDDHQRELIFDPQTSGGLLIFVAEQRADALVEALRDGGDAAAEEIGEVVGCAPRLTII